VNVIHASATALGALNTEQVELALDVTKDEIWPSSQHRFRRKLVGFDEETWHALNLLSRESMKTFQELADEAFRDPFTRNTDGRPI
jgi:hypothetical protein